MSVSAGQTLTFPIRSDKFTMSVQVSEVLHRQQSEFQLVEIFDTEAFGRMLFLDGHVQLAELDEEAYHECLVHIPLLNVARPKKALVVGGGDGGVLRELLKYPDLEIDLVEIDMAVIEASRAHLEFLNQGVFEHPRVNLFVQDAFPFVKQTGIGPYDLIVMDSTDTYEEEDGEISAMLFTQEFFKDCKSLLSDQGFVVTQADNLVFCPYSLVSIWKEYSKVFPQVGSYSTLVPSFGGFSGYCYASKGVTISQEFPSERAELLKLHYLNALTYKLALAPFHLGA